jgi:hypothetical protein
MAGQEVCERSEERFHHSHRHYHHNRDERGRFSTRIGGNGTRSKSELTGLEDSFLYL